MLVWTHTSMITFQKVLTEVCLSLCCITSSYNNTLHCSYMKQHFWNTETQKPHSITKFGPGDRSPLYHCPSEMSLGLQKSYQQIQFYVRQCVSLHGCKDGLCSLALIVRGVQQLTVAAVNPVRFNLALKDDSYLPTMYFISFFM